jgi:SAM-dependent methyltransferase
MEGYDIGTYGQRFAEVYDELYDGYDDAAITTLADLAREGCALELGIGTGRIALPLAAHGVEVHGIDASPEMVARLRAKPGGAALPVSIGDFAEVAVEGLFSLIFIVFSTFFALTSQDTQVHCFRAAASHLGDGGVFLIEAFVPDMTRFTRGQNTQVSRVERDWVMLDVARHDPVNQQVRGQHIRIDETGARLHPVLVRYAWPSELDLMARLAGLRLRHRWGGWSGEPLTVASHRHVSIYERAADG